MNNKCLVEKCDNELYSKSYCRKHFNQIKKYGKILERTHHDPNEFIIDNNICWIILYDKNNEEKARTKIDIKYYEQICSSKLKWCLTNKGYVRAIWRDLNGIKYQTSLHESIIYLSEKIVPNNYQIDHFDGDPLNNLEENLRICTSSQNSHNTKRHRDSKSAWKGICWHKQTKKWQAQITLDYGQKYLGTFDTAEDAARAYNEAAKQYFGEFAALNQIDD